MPADKDLIFGLIKSSVGFKGLNHIVASQMRQWLAQRAVQLVEDTGVTFQEAEERPGGNQSSSFRRESVKGKVVIERQALVVGDDSDDDDNDSSESSSMKSNCGSFLYNVIKANGYECALWH